MQYPKRIQYKYAKSGYRVRNWPEYEAGLQRRGSLTVRLSDAALDAWRARAPALIQQLKDPVASVSADGAYDTADVYEAAQMMGDGHAVAEA